MPESSWQLFDHTADLGVQVRASTREALYETAARALFEILGDAGDPPAAPRRIDLLAADAEELLIRWLAELLCIHEVEGLRFDRFAVDFDGPGSLHGVASASGPAGPLGPGREIKAVTYHSAQVVRQPDGTWTARFVLDV